MRARVGNLVCEYQYRRGCDDESWCWADCFFRVVTTMMRSMRSTWEQLFCSHRNPGLITYSVGVLTPICECCVHLGTCTWHAPQVRWSCLVNKKPNLLPQSATWSWPLHLSRSCPSIRTSVTCEISRWVTGSYLESGFPSRCCDTTAGLDKHPSRVLRMHGSTANPPVSATIPDLRP